MKKLILLAAAIAQLAALPNFIDAGIPLTTQELDTLKANINHVPWMSGYAALAGDGQRDAWFFRMFVI